MATWEKVKTNIHNIMVGDTVEHNGEIKTVGRESFGGDSFIGVTLWGDSYWGGHKAVTKLVYVKPATR